MKETPDSDFRNVISFFEKMLKSVNESEKPVDQDGDSSRTMQDVNEWFAISKYNLPKIQLTTFIQKIENACPNTHPNQHVNELISIASECKTIKTHQKLINTLIDGITSELRYLSSSEHISSKFSAKFSSEFLLRQHVSFRLAYKRDHVLEVKNALEMMKTEKENVESDNNIRLERLKQFDDNNRNAIMGLYNTEDEFIKAFTEGNVTEEYVLEHLIAVIRNFKRLTTALGEMEEAVKKLIEMCIRGAEFLSGYRKTYDSDPKMLSDELKEEKSRQEEEIREKERRKREQEKKERDRLNPFKIIGKGVKNFCHSIADSFKKA